VLILRRCAMRTQTALGAFHRRLAVRIGKPVYRVLSVKLAYADPGATAYHERNRARLRSMRKRVKLLGLELFDLSTGDILLYANPVS
jgi:hypothetical protein